MRQNAPALLKAQLQAADHVGGNTLVQLPGGQNEVREDEIFYEEITVFGEAGTAARAGQRDTASRIVGVRHPDNLVRILAVHLSEKRELIGECESHVAVHVCEQLGELSACRCRCRDDLVGIEALQNFRRHLCADVVDAAGDLR